MVNFECITNDGLIKCSSIKFGNAIYSRGDYLPMDDMHIMLYQPENLRLLATITETGSIEFDHKGKYITSKSMIRNGGLVIGCDNNDERAGLAGLAALFGSWRN